MWIGIVSLLPELIVAATRSGGVVGRAIEQGRLTLQTFNPRDFTADRHRTVDDKPYGGGAGMVMMSAPLTAALDAARQAAPAPARVVLMSPQGRVFDQAMAVSSSNDEALILICGRYEGVDERFVRQHVDQEWSIGDYVVSGGELPALVVMDAIARHVPGTLGNRLSIFDESHLDGTLDYPHYTRPVESDGVKVPAELLSGDHREVARYRRREALYRTFERRPELLVRRVFSQEDRELLLASMERHARDSQNEANNA